MKKDKKKGTSKKTWVVDCRTDCAFNFALKVLKEAENNSYPFALRANFAKIAYMNSCETIAKAQTDPREYKLSSSFKLFNRNIKQIFKLCDKLFHEKYDTTENMGISYNDSSIKNPFDYVDINYSDIERAFNNAKNGNRIGSFNIEKYISVYHYPMIYEKTITIPGLKNNCLLPTNDIIVYIPDTVKRVFKAAEDSNRLYADSNIMKNQEYINLIKGETNEIPEPTLIHVPDDSFENISSLITAAAIRPDNVEEICLTAYRLGKNNKMIDYIIKASNNNIYCKLYIELSARGEIDKDIKYLQKLISDANHDYLDVKVHYNGIKVHGKMIYIKLKSNNAIGVFSTGNYNEDTALIYKDYHYISCEDNVTEMIRRNFSILWNSNQPVMSSISNILSKEIYDEIAKGKDGKIWIQTNHLDNKLIITLLNEAMSRGCDVKLIVRTTKGFHNKEMKNCRTVVGKYLEHSRVYIFGSGKGARVYLSSSDILFRNLYNRFESYVKIFNEDIKNRLIADFRILYKNGQE